MKTGKHTAVEVPAATTVDGCWQLVETAERQRLHCVMMENCNYGRSEMMVLKMVRAGLFGELLHGEGAYIHDLRSIKFSDKNEGLWRLATLGRAQWQPLPDPRSGTDRPVHGHQPWRPLRLSGLDELESSRPEALRRGAPAGRTTREESSTSPWAT